MEKIAFVGMERMGKSTLINRVAGELSTLGISYLLMPEVTMKPNNLIKDLGNPEVQMSLIFEQMSDELAYSINNYKDVILVDRTPIETLMYMDYLLEGAKIDYYLYAHTKRLVLAWMRTYKTIYYVESSNVPLKENAHFTKKDIAIRADREKFLKTYIHAVKHVTTAITVGDKSIAKLIAKEIGDTVNGN